MEKKKKRWKFEPSDLSERKLWDTYSKHYEQAINATSLPHAHWYVIPADDKKLARHLVAEQLFYLFNCRSIKSPSLGKGFFNNKYAFIAGGGLISCSWCLCICFV